MKAPESAVRAFAEQLAPVGGGLESLGGDVQRGPDPLLSVAQPIPEQLHEAAGKAVEKTRTNQPLNPNEQFALEAIIIPDKRPAVRILNNDYQVAHPLWQHFNQGPIKDSICRMLPSVGRIDLPKHPTLPYGGTGFVVGKDLLMTNRHVAEIFCSGLGEAQELVFDPTFGTGVDFRRETTDQPEVLLSVRRVMMIHPYWDMALLSVEGLGPQNLPLQFSLRPPESLQDRDVAVIGYPAFDPRNDAGVQNQVFDGVYNVKRLQPGKLRPRQAIESFGHDVQALTHDSSTMGGNSGSVVFDPVFQEVVALHFAGIYLRANYGVPGFELGRDGRVIDAGVRFASSPTRAAVLWDSFWSGTRRSTESKPSDPGIQTPPSQGASVVTSNSSDGGTCLTISVPIEITVRVGVPVTQQGPVRAEAVVAPQGMVLERAVEPTHDDDLSSRQGYDPAFLGVNVPLPEPTDLKTVALVTGGDPLLRYHHFSLVMNKVRRLAVFTASNLDDSEAARRPEPGKNYTRKGLTGLGKNDQEKWFTDSRISASFQLPDRFFTKDNGAWDKGHIVRREDVAWGSSYQEIVAANGDTFHVTNCSPQVAGFNRSNLGVDNWGALENYVMKQAGTERLSLFAGPVLRDDDPIFVGVDDAGPVRVKIPQHYWKLVLAVQNGALQSFAFLLEQDLSDVPLEFVVSPAWKQFMVGVADLEAMLSLKFPQEVHDSDQIDTVAGEHVRTNSGTGRKRTRE
jgi:endonuclease G